MGLFSTLAKGISSGVNIALGTGSKLPTVSTASKSTQKVVVSGLASKLAASIKNTSNSNNNKSGGTKPSASTPQTPAAPSADDVAASSGDLIRWSGAGGLSFFVKPDKIHAMKEITITASPETEDKENGDEKVTSLKKKGKIKVTMTGILMAALGADVENMAMHAIDAARKGETGYLYLAGKKMFTPSFMMTKADAKNIHFGTDGKWIQCELSMELSQCSKYDGTTSTGGGGSGYKYSCTVYYSGSSGAVSSVTGYSNVSKEDARKKAWAKVPSNAQWASETPKQATNQTGGTSSGTKATDTISKAKQQSQQVYNNSKRNQGGTTGGGLPGASFD